LVRDGAALVGPIFSPQMAATTTGAAWSFAKAWGFLFLGASH
jgi:hypothetical protein